MGLDTVSDRLGRFSDFLSQLVRKARQVAITAPIVETYNALQLPANALRRLSAAELGHLVTGLCVGRSVAGISKDVSI